MRRFLTPLWLLICLALIVLWAISPPPSEWLDKYYTHGIYPAITSVLVPLTGSVALPMTPLLLAALLLWLVLSIMFVKRRRRGWRAFWRWLWRGLVTVVTLYALFIVVWGANYGRTPLEARLHLSSTTPTDLETIFLAENLGTIIRQDGDAPLRWDADLKAGQASLRRVIAQLEHRSVTLPRNIKRTPPGFLLYTGRATGLMVPWTLEGYVDPALPAPFALATALHESAHIAGYASEAEADFITALAGLTSENASVRYSVALMLFTRMSHNLLPERYHKIYVYLTDRTKRELAALPRVYHRYRAPPLVAQLQTRIYDGYLRSQRVSAGIDDYDRAIELLLAAQHDDVIEFHWENVELNLSD